MLGVTERLPRIAASAAVAVATAIVLVALAIVPFLNPVWVSFEQGRSEAAAWTGYTAEELRTATDGILGDLLLWRGDFDVRIGGEAVLTATERAHMIDVRRVFAGFGIAAIVAAGALVFTRRRATDRPAFWRSVRAGAVGLALGVVIVGVVSVVAFDAVFELFHRIFFSGGNYLFDPTTDRLVQLFPYRFWLETSFALGCVVLLLSAVTIVIADRRLGGTPAARAVRPVPIEVGR
jgi:integral membrane protein (TIGR01906 family)